MKNIVMLQNKKPNDVKSEMTSNIDILYSLENLINNIHLYLNSIECLFCKLKGGSLEERGVIKFPGGVTHN